jgi:RNA polymerase primary sigma factor
MKEVNQAKDKVQRETLNAWWKAKYKGTIEAATGFGKSRVGVLAAVKTIEDFGIENTKILIIAPTDTIKDEWTQHFKDWNETKAFKSCVTVLCINTARTLKKQHYNLVIADEIHNYLRGKVNSKFFANNTYDRILGLSGTIEDNLLEYINDIAPICYNLTLEKAEELGLISEYTVINIPVDLTIPERKDYDKYSKKIKFIWENYSTHSWGNISARKEILYHAKAKVRMIKKLIKLFGEDQYGIIFTMTKKHADIIHKKLAKTSVPHHSGYSKKERVAFLKSYADGRTNIKLLVSAKTLDEGVNIPRVIYSIIAANSSTSRQMNQRVGRCIRLGEDGKHAIILRLYCKNTKEEDWVRTSQSKIKSIDVQNIEELIKLLNQLK